MLTEMILKRQLTDAERRAILNKTGYSLDVEIERGARFERARGIVVDNS